MFTLLRRLSVRQLLTEQFPAVFCAWLIAEWFYKFHSFTLECAAFLATWLVFDAVLQGIKRLVSRYAPGEQKAGA